MKIISMTFLLLFGIFSSVFASEDDGCFDYYKAEANHARLKVNDLVDNDEISMYYGIIFQNAIRGAISESKNAMRPCGSLENSLRMLDLAILHAKRNRKH